MGSNLRTVALVTLIVQNTALVLLMRYSRTVDGPVYFASTAVATMEVLKFVVCTYMVAKESGVRAIHGFIVGRPTEVLRLAVPSLLYTVQNNLLYYALSNLDAAVYQVSYQIKILTTALFSVTMLQRSLNPQKWTALLFLALGVALVQLAPHMNDKGDAEESSGAVDSGQSPILGFIAVVGASVTSGFSGVYFEKILKGSSDSLWTRNIQMGVTSVVLGFVGVLTKDWEGVSKWGFFYGYTPVVWTVVLLQAGGGLVVAMVTKHADTILKCFATSISIVCSTLISVLFFNFSLNFVFGFGTFLVITAIFLYTQTPMQKFASGKATSKKGDDAEDRV